LLYSPWPARRDQRGAASIDWNGTDYIGFVIPASTDAIPVENDRKAQETPKDRPAPVKPN
jgi:hypothetical protein